MKKKIFKRVGSAVLSLAVLTGGAVIALPQIAESGIEVQAANSERDFYTEENDDGTITITGYKGASKTVNIPASVFGQKVTKISGYKGGFDSATSIVIPNSVKSISGGAFENCKSLKSVTIPDSVKELGSSIFSGCTSLTTVRLPSKLDSDGYGGYIFDGCTSLKTYSIPNGWTCIPVGMFKDCTALTSVTIPKSVEKIGSGYYFSSGAFQGCTGLKSINIPDSVNYIGFHSFRKSGLQSISIPDSVTELLGYSFLGCTSLRSVKLPKNIEYISGDLFCDCSSLTELEIPGKVTSIHDYAFSGCSSLRKLILPASVNSISGTVFGYTWGDLSELAPPNLVIYGKKNSYVDKFANNHDIQFKALVDVSGIALNTSGVAMEAKETYQLKATVNPANASINSVIWKSSNPDIATVSLSGKVTAVKSGIATVTATTSNGKTAKCTVTVFGPPTSVKLSSSQMSLGKGETKQLTATVGPQYARNKTVKWTSSNSNVLTVDRKGKVTVVGKGTAVVTATSKGNTKLSKTCKITVKNAPTKITLTKGILTIGVGEKYTLGASVNDGAAAAKRTYRTSNSKIVKMTRTDWQGEFVGVKPGVAYVTVRTYNGKESTCKVTVKAAPTSVTISKKTLTMKVGQTATLSCWIPSNAGCAARTFRTSNASVVKMTKTNWTGSFKAMKPGVAYVTVRTYNGKESTCKVTVVK